MSKTKERKVEIREIVYSQDDEKSFGDIFVYEPENIEEQNLGNLFIVGELKDLPRNCSYIINLLASKIKKEFYSNTKRGTEDSLEAGLSVANQTLSELAEQGNGEYVGKLSMVCGTYQENKFFLSQVGKIKSLLVRDGQLMEIMKEDGSAVSAKRAFNNIASGELAGDDLVIFATPGLFNVFSLEEIRQLASSTDLDDFTAKVQEEIEEEDDEIVSALVMKIEGEKKEGISRVGIVPEEKIEEPLIEEPLEEPKNVTEKITTDDAEEDAKKMREKPYTQEAFEASREHLKNEGDDFIQPEKTQEIELERKLQEKEGSMNTKEKDETEDNTGNRKNGENENLQTSLEFSKNVSENIPDSVSPASIQPALGETDATTLLQKDVEKVSLSDIIKEYEKRESTFPDNNEEKNKSLEHIISKKQPTNFEDLDEQESEAFHKKIASKAKNYLDASKINGAKTAFSGKIKKVLESKKVKEYKVTAASSGNNSIKKLSLIPNKKLIAAALVLLLIGAEFYYVSNIKSKKGAEDKLASYQAMLVDSRSKMDIGETDLISGKESEAGQLFVEAKALALRVKNEYGNTLSSDADAIIAQAQQEIDKLDKVVRIDNPTVSASFENTDVKNLIEINEVDYAIDGKANVVYKVDTNNSKLVQAAKASDALGILKFAQNLQNQEILLSDSSGFSSFSIKNNAIQKLDTILSSSAKDLAVYTKNIYVLSPSENQIYKYQKSSNSLTGKTSWLKSGDIKDAISLTVDQYIYILTSDGQVKKYYMGNEWAETNGTKFSIQQPSDQISSPGKIYTLTGGKYLYVTEPAKNRVLMFDKNNGSLIKQIVSSDFSSLQDISVDAKETSLTTLVSGKIVKVDLTK